MSMKEYLEVLDGRFASQQEKEEHELVETFINFVHEEKSLYLDRALAVIREYEMTPYEHRQRRLKQEAEAKRLKEEQESGNSSSSSASNE